ncbi:hypothetical protein PR003_g5721 [Phytophthora rubi]|uniref:Uncharacterized protein n=1 Tax=Phytophthora rubi TaxID=129364 RepID=A0A6A3N1X9_9STRA|nr:hypothetical protein PR002_g7530 [Phytophthora rubi]KAE9349766.1 hypothetical protein PR003_g5721 [Phytophthora rubi]
MCFLARKQQKTSDCKAASLLSTHRQIRVLVLLFAD